MREVAHLVRRHHPRHPRRTDPAGRTRPRSRSPRTAWTIAAYETPVSDRMWHLALSGATPAPVLQTLLNRLAAGDAWETAIGSAATEETVAEATRPLTDAGWRRTVDGRWIRWETLQADAGVQFDAFAAQNPHSTLATWTLWAGPSIDRPTWAIHASPYTPAPLLTRVAEELAHGTRTRESSPAKPRSGAHLTTTPPPLPPAPASQHTSRHR